MNRRKVSREVVKVGEYRRQVSKRKLNRRKVSRESISSKGW